MPCGRGPTCESPGRRWPDALNRTDGAGRRTHHRPARAGPQEAAGRRPLGGLRHARVQGCDQRQERAARRRGRDRGVVMPAALAGKRIVTKKRCCRDSPRCRKCPVVWKRLETSGDAEREDRRVYNASETLKKKSLKAARKRG